ncbi:long-chain-fatty-acid--CoA ligase 4-like [Brevipalpus obovatus]|uniref:long-chain-fatty-acid--CoA ligase 4-like n=1 Tax=Brevipalpus obovatus TaxID=246614 RepID=UPI003D9E0AC8
MSHKVVESILHKFFWSTASVLDTVLLPIHLVIQDPIKTFRKSRQLRIKPLSAPVTNGLGRGLVMSGPLERAKLHSFDESQLGIGIWKTLSQWFEFVAKKYADQPCLGTRARLSEVIEDDQDGKPVKKFVLDDQYKFITYSEALRQRDLIVQHLYRIGIRERQIVPIFSENRQEWVLVSQALWKVNAIVTTIYPNVGIDGIAHILNNSMAEHLFTSEQHLKKLINLKRAGKLPHLRTVVYFSNLPSIQSENIDSNTSTEEFELMSFENLLSGKSDTLIEKSVITRKGSDVVMVIYTSGSTGIPKGVMITADNAKDALRALISSVICEYIPKENEVSLSILPLAHIYELGGEMTFLTLGVPIAYSSPYTLVTGAPGLCKGSTGDITLVRPTVILSVPLILERIRKSIEDKLKGKPAIAQIFQFCLQYKLFWYKIGFNTPLIDRFIFSAAQNAFGGRLRLVIVGGGPLLEDTQAFIALVLNIKLFQGYGSTECCGTALLSDIHDRSFGQCGAPLIGTTIRLVEWKEGGYSPNDKPNPRGEVYVGGATVAQGYFKDPEEDKKSFFTDEDGKTRYWASGDIGELYPNGTIRIIDRRKDLIKIFNGEYISLAKVENVLKSCSLVDNICVYASFAKPYLIALVTPNKINFGKLVESLKKQEKSFADQCQDSQITEAFLNDLRNNGEVKGLASYEIPKRILICSQEWNPDNGLVTVSLKIRRHKILEHYAREIEMLYEGNHQ